MNGRELLPSEGDKGLTPPPSSQLLPMPPLSLPVLNLSPSLLLSSLPLASPLHPCGRPQPMRPTPIQLSASWRTAGTLGTLSLQPTPTPWALCTMCTMCAVCTPPMTVQLGIGAVLTLVQLGRIFSVVNSAFGKGAREWQEGPLVAILQRGPPERSLENRDFLGPNLYCCSSCSCCCWWSCWCWGFRFKGLPSSNPLSSRPRRLLWEVVLWWRHEWERGPSSGLAVMEPVWLPGWLSKPPLDPTPSAFLNSELSSSSSPPHLSQPLQSRSPLLPGPPPAPAPSPAPAPPLVPLPLSLPLARGLPLWLP